MVWHILPQNQNKKTNGLTLVATLLVVVIPTSGALGILSPKPSLIIVYSPLLITYTFVVDFITT